MSGGPALPAAGYSHATAVVIGERGLVLTGASGAGKSALADRLITEARARGYFSRLIGDDRVALRASSGRVLVSAHPAIAGRIERRGVGIVDTQWLEAAVVRGVVALVSTAPRLPEARDQVIEICGITLPLLSLRAAPDLAAKADLVLNWLAA